VDRAALARAVELNLFKKTLDGGTGWIYSSVERVQNGRARTRKGAVVNITVLTYALYLLLSIVLTIWVARTLFVNGRVFLVDVFRGNDQLADSVNHLLVVGFYLVNLGYITLALKLGYDVQDLRFSIEALSRKVGGVLLVLGFMHFFNLFVFSRIRQRAVYNAALPTATSMEGRR
jgi:hypothetical protein